MNLLPAIIAALVAAAPSDRVRKALDDVLAKGSYQTELPSVAAEEVSTRRAVPAAEREAGQAPVAFSLGRAVPVLFWAALAALAVVALVALWPAADGPGPAPDAPTAPGAPRPPPRPGARPALTKVDELARMGDFGAAIHQLLLCALDELGSRASSARAPSLTAREVLDRARPTESARSALAMIVAEAERVHFGGRAAGKAEYERCLAEFRRFQEERRPKGRG